MEHRHHSTRAVASLRVRGVPTFCRGTVIKVAFDNVSYLNINLTAQNMELRDY